MGVDNMWIVNIYYDDAREHIFKSLEFLTLGDIAYCLDCPTHSVSNFYHKIKKPRGVFKKLYIYKTPL